MTFTIQLAEKAIEIKSLYDQTYKMCTGYIPEERSAEKPDLVIEITQEDIVQEAEAAKAENQKIGKHYNISPAQLETSAVYRKIATELLPFDVILMHGSVISTAEKGYMITAPSGVGKTTRSRIWTECIPDSVIVNGDKPLLQVTDDCIYAYGTPWCGKEGWNANTSVPLQAIFLLERSEKGNWITGMSFAEAFPQLLHQTFRPDDANAKRKTLQLLQKMAGKVRIYRFCSEPTAEAVRMAWEAAGGQR